MIIIRSQIQVQFVPVRHGTTGPSCDGHSRTLWLVLRE